MSLSLEPLALVSTFCEIAITWMILQDYRKDRGKPELSGSRLIVMLALSLGPLIAIGIAHSFPTLHLSAALVITGLALSVIVVAWDVYYVRRHYSNNKISKREYKPEPGLDTTTFNVMNNQFESNFSWAQKVALSLIYERPYTRPNTLRAELLSFGFGRDVDEFIIEPIKQLDRTFIEMTPDGEIMPNPGRAKIVRVLLNRFRRNIL